MALSTISLCAGVGGLDLGLRLATDTRTVCYVEWGKFPAAVIAARIADESLDDAPIWDDVTTFDGRPWRGKVDCVAAGFPCQPVSLAGRRLGMSDERFIWGDIARILSEVGPRYVFLENVPGIVTADGGAFLGRVLGDLVQCGFDCEWDIFSAEETDAPHRRERWFCLAHGNSQRERQLRGGVAHERAAAAKPSPLVGDAGGTRRQNSPEQIWARLDAGCDQLDHPNRARSQEQWQRLRVASELGNSESTSPYAPTRDDYDGWSELIATDPSLEPAICRDADGLAPRLDPALFAYRNDRLRAIGNGVVPLTAALAWTELTSRLS